ncbi:MAG: PEP/pyruvate-binding domain-containing protein [Desulfobacterales bacterium]
MKSKALEINLADYHIEVTIEERYAVLQEVMSRYYGLMEGLNNFLKEISHPYKNWNFIVAEARGYSLEYFHLLRNHAKGPQAASLFVDIFHMAIESTADSGVRTEAVDNLLLFLQKIIKDSGSQIDRFRTVLGDAFDRIRKYEDEKFFLFVKSYYQIKRLAELILDCAFESTPNYRPLNALLFKYFEQTYAYWLAEADPQNWFATESEATNLAEDIRRIFDDVSHTRIKRLDLKLKKMNRSADIESETALKQLLTLPGYNQFVEIYRNLPQQLYEAGRKSRNGNQWKVIFLFHIMNISGLSAIHEEALREINRTLSWLIDHETDLNIRRLIEKTFSILKESTFRFPATALNCILNMGKGVYKTDESDLINYFIDGVVESGFQSPMIGGVGNDWRIRANSVHIQNIRTWLEIIELNPKWSIRLLSAMIIHISLSGILLKDTDLFPRDITRLLNSDIGPVYNLVKQLARLFPVYFNDIGAEGKLRDISTRIDEITHRKDALIHFLRKQSHVESSNQILGFIEATLDFWATREKERLEAFVPPNIYHQISCGGPFIEGVNRIMSALAENEVAIPEGLLLIEKDKLLRMLENVSGVSEIDRERVRLAADFYKLLHQKYNLSFIELSNYIAQLATEALPDLNRLKAALEEPDLKRKLFMLVDYLNQLKILILSSETYTVREDIYKKRHITVDIPSMYGSYHEMKFDALGLTFRIESLVNVLFEELIENIDLSLITKATFYQIYAHIRLIDKALKLDGISSNEIERQLDLLAHSLEVKGFTFTQYLDIFKGFARAVKNIINDYFHHIHEENLTRILSQIPADSILAKYLPVGDNGLDDREKLRHRVSEIFFRDRIAHSLGLQQLDRFISRILNTLFQQSDKLPKDKLHQLLLYDPENATTGIHEPDSRVTGLIYLGQKGLNLIRLHGFGLPVPPGFIITTEVFRCREMIERYQPAEQNLKEQIARHIDRLENVTGKHFGDPANPLLFSVRSGSSISQPGMMDTFLNVGMNEEIAAGLANLTGNSWFAWDTYRRFLQCYGMSFGLERDDFDAVIRGMKQKVGVAYKRQFSGDQMHQVAMTYKAMIQDSGIEILEHPFEQLFLTIKEVLDSWESEKARTFRKILGISDDWGTAVTVQAMIYGNISENSGSGVIFTHNPRWPGEKFRLWGDFTLGNQGEDVVSGLVNTMPISINQQEVEMRETDITLETHYPEIYNSLKNWANDLIYEKGWSPQELEFTFESPSVMDLYLLQSRDMVMRERKRALTFDILDKSDEKYLGHGIGISGGAMSGRVVFNLEDIDKWRRQEPDTSLILARADTVPDDIRQIYAADGLLTARGGVTSHASVVAHRLGKTCVVGCGDLICDEKEKNCYFNGVRVNSGDYISIDGEEGSVYLGRVRVNK